MENQDVKTALKNFFTSLGAFLKLLLETLVKEIKNLNAENTKTGLQKFLTVPVVSKVGAVLAALLTLTWFMPVVKFWGGSYSMLDALDQIGGSDAAEAVVGFWGIVIMCAALVVFSLMTKKKASIVGAVDSALLVVYSYIQVSDWKSNFDLAIGAKLMTPLAVLLLIASAVKLVLILKAGNQKNAGAGNI